MSHSVASLLSQIRDLHAQMPGGMSVQTPRDLDGNTAAGHVTTAGAAVQTPSFVDTLKRAMEGVNDAQQHASARAAAFERGEPGADLAQVMVAAQQAQVAFRATVEVRNRLVQAYQDVLNMPV